MGKYLGMALKTDSLQITPEILALIAEIDEFKGAWRALGTLAPARRSALRRVATIESIGSSTRIEGSKLSDAEVEAFLSRLDLKTFASRDEQEVAGYAQVMETLFAHFDAIDLTENHLVQLHRDLLAFSDKDERHRGAYETPQRMAELVAWTRSALIDKSLHPLLVIAVFTVVFLEIHPFQDGNGRLSRALTTLLLLRSGYAYVPYSSLESVIENSKEGYCLALRQTQKTIRSVEPNWQPWTVYFLRALQQQKRRLEKKIERERIVMGALPELSLQIIDAIKERGRITIGEIVNLTGANRNTVKKHLASLVAGRHISQQGVGKGTWYGQP
jgi:Fic family protein